MLHSCANKTEEMKTLPSARNEIQNPLDGSDISVKTEIHLKYFHFQCRVQPHQRRVCVCVQVLNIRRYRALRH